MQKFVKTGLLKAWVPVCVAVVLLLGGCGSSGTGPTFNVSGGWFMYHDTAGVAGVEGSNLFTFTTSNNDISGTTDQGQPIKGSIDGLAINFSFVGSDGASNSWVGTVSIDGASMSGTWSDTNKKTGNWHAVIDQAARVNISGSWNASLVTTGVAGAQAVPIVFTQPAGNAFSGTTSLDASAKITGSIGLQDLFFWAEINGATFSLSGVAASDGKSMSGTWFNSSGQSGTWTASKS